MINTKVLIVGASGLVGSEILKCVQKLNQEIILLSRNPLSSIEESTKELITSFDNLNQVDFPSVDHVYIAIGKKLEPTELLYIPKSKRDEFVQTDCNYVVNISKKAHEKGAKSIAVVSAVGANISSNNLYLKTKGNMENQVKEIGYKKVVFAQPSHLLGERPKEKFRIDVPLIELGGKIFDPFMQGPLSDLRFISAKKVAHAMVKKMNEDSEGLSALKYTDFIVG